MSGENTNNTYTNVSDLPTMSEITSPAYVPVEDENKEGKKVDLNTFYTKTQADAAFVSSTGYVATDNNYTTDEKIKLAGIEAGAQANVKPDWDAEAGSDAEILNKPVVPPAGYTRVTYDNIRMRYPTVPVNNRESITVNLIGSSSADNLTLELSEGADDAIIRVNVPDDSLSWIRDITVRRGNTYLTRVYPAIPNAIFSTTDDTLITTVLGGSGEAEVPSSFSEVRCGRPHGYENAALSDNLLDEHEILYEAKTIICRIVADFCYVTVLANNGF